MNTDLFGTAIPAPPKATERDVLDALRHRFAHRGGNGERYVLAEHVRDHGAFARRTADLLVRDLWESAGVALHGFEVKVSRADWLTELRDPSKAERFKRHCDFWWLAVHDAAIVHDDLPDGWGLIVRSGDSMRIRRQAPRLSPEPMDPAMRASLDRSIAKTARRHLVLDSEAGRPQECERYVYGSCITHAASTLCWSCRANAALVARDSRAAADAAIRVAQRVIAGEIPLEEARDHTGSTIATHYAIELLEDLLDPDDDRTTQEPA